MNMFADIMEKRKVGVVGAASDGTGTKRKSLEEVTD